MKKSELRKIIREELSSYPSFQLLRQYPGMKYEEGTIFTKEDEGHGYTPDGKSYSSVWDEEYFTEWPEYFKATR